MGLREKALLFRRNENPNESESFDFSVDFISKFSGKIIPDSELEIIQAHVERLASDLERKSIDIQTLFEIARELNSTLQLDDLIQIVIFTLIGHFQVSNVAIFEISADRADTAMLIGQRGFSDLIDLYLTEEFKAFLSQQHEPLTIESIAEFEEEYGILSEAGGKTLIPMKGKENLSGLVLTGERLTGNEYTAEERSFLFTVASLAGIAIENASLYAKLDRKYRELSTLYDVSRVINSSDDYDIVIELILETITTGFGVNKALLYSEKEGRYEILRVVGLDSVLVGSELKISESQSEAFEGSETQILPISRELLEYANTLNMLLVPLESAGTRIGGLIIFEMEESAMDPDINKDLTSLFAIIASQIAPPILMTKIMKEDKEKVQDPFTPVLALIEDAISRSKDFDMDATFAMLKLTRFKNYASQYGGENAHGKFADMSSKVQKILPESAGLIRYSSGSLLFSLPAISESDFEELRDGILFEAKKVFGNEKELDIGIDFADARYPQNASDAFEILSLLE